MSERTRPEMERICGACGRSNPPSEDICVECFADISQVTPTPVVGDSASPEEESPSEGSRAGEAERGPRNECPECGTDLDGMSECPRCGESVSGYCLCWQEIDLGKTPVTGARPVFVGRVPPVDSELTRHIDAGFPWVSRVHAEIFGEQGGCIYVRDLNSKNGTFVNQQRIAAYIPRQLQAGDTVSFSRKLSAKVEKS